MLDRADELNKQETAPIEEHYYPVLGEAFKDLDQKVEVKRPHTFREAEHTREFAKNMAIADALQPAEFPNIETVTFPRKKGDEILTPDVEKAAIDMLEDSTRLSVTRIVNQKINIHNKVGGVAHPQGEKASEDEHAQMFVRELTGLRREVISLASKKQREKDPSELAIFTKIEVIARAIESGHTEYAPSKEIDMDTHEQLGGWEAEQNVRETLGKQLRALAVKEVSDRMVEKYTDTVSTKDVRWGAEVQMDDLIDELSTPGVTVEAVRKAMEVLKKYNASDDDNPEKVIFSLETSTVAKKVMGEREHGDMEEAAHAEGFKNYMESHLGPGKSLLSRTKKSQSMPEININDSGAVERVAVTEPTGVGLENLTDIKSVGIAALKRTTETGFAFFEFGENKQFKMDLPGFSRAFSAEIARQFEPNSTELAYNVSMIKTMEMMAANFNTVLEKDIASGQATQDEGKLTNEDVIKMACLIIGRRAALKANPDVALDSRVAIFANPTTAPTRATELTAEFARGLEFFDQKLAQVQNTEGDLTAQQQMELSYGFIAFAQAFQSCNKKWAGRETWEAATTITVFPAIIGTDETYNETDPLLTPVKISKGKKK